MKKLDKRILLSLILSCVTISMVPAASPWIHRFETSSTINLASRDFWFPTGEWSANATSTNRSYGDKQILAVVGIMNSSEETTVTFDSDWYLTSISDPSLKRPFSVCLVPRVSQMNYPNPHSTNYQRYGYGGMPSAIPFTLPKTDGSRIRTNGVSVVTNGAYDYGLVDAAWIDIVLVLDPVLLADGTLPGEGTDICNVATGDDYIGQMRVTIQSGNAYESTVFYMNGYFGDYAGSVSTAQLVITPDASSTSAFDIVNNHMIPVKIADVDFTTSSLADSTAPPNAYYLFVSSSSDINTQGSLFEFKRRGSTSASNAYNSCTYEIIPYASRGTVPIGLSYDGRMTFHNSTRNDWMQAALITYTTGNGRGTIYNTDFQGSLYLRVTGDVDHLLAGAYETNIFIHVITDI